MLHRVSIAAALIAGVIAGGEVANTAALNSGYRVVAGSEHPSVDVELVLAVDVSYSMDPGELLLQREGYAEAIVPTNFSRRSRPGRTEGWPWSMSNGLDRTIRKSSCRGD